MFTLEILFVFAQISYNVRLMFMLSIWLKIVNR